MVEANKSESEPRGLPVIIRSDSWFQNIQHTDQHHRIPGNDQRANAIGLCCNVDSNGRSSRCALQYHFGSKQNNDPANSSFGYLDIQILNAGASAGQAKFLGIQLDSTGTLMPSVNYRSLGLVIDQR
jgi:hypothetical protein